MKITFLYGQWSSELGMEKIYGAQMNQATEGILNPLEQFLSVFFDVD